jgi:phosphoribosylformylglycinamidine synthase subunit PurSL
MKSALQTHQVIIGPKESGHDHKSLRLLKAVKQYLRLEIENIKMLRAYRIVKDLAPDLIEEIAEHLLIDPILETRVYLESLADFNWMIEVAYKDGVTDNSGNTARITIEDYLTAPFNPGESVHSSTIILIKGKISLEDAKSIAEELLANPLIESISIRNTGLPHTGIEVIDLNVSDEELAEISKSRQLALTLGEMKAIQKYYLSNDAKRLRDSHGLPPGPTDVELEALAQTWSEHCKHKIFQAKIHYTEDGKTTIIDSLFKTYIVRATEDLREKCPWLVSVFTDNAGIIKFDDKYNLAFKVETHNSPSALDPYGGALTGILGVNRDIMGAGIGARLIANTDILCFAPPNYNKPLPKRLLHPKRIFDGVRLGIEHGGNKSGVPTVNGAVVFDDCYAGKPLVYCGSVGIMPARVNGKDSHLKEILPGDLIVAAGGRTGKDGIHGATFSSEELSSESPSSAVQIGDPFTQKKLHDFLLDARDKGYYRTVTDNGAGGFSSSVGELAELSGGCEIHLDQALLKQDNLAPWEILLSESQERMTLAVAQGSWNDLACLSKVHEIELCVIGTFTDTGYFHALYENETVGVLPLSFMHKGLPQMELAAEWVSNESAPIRLPALNHGKTLHDLLGRFNICSKESVIRQYDHEVQGGSVLKPLTGIDNDGPSDAAVLKPLETLDQKTGIALSNGICPRYSPLDAYHMAACAVDEAVRNCVAVGSDPKTIAILDNFCWPDPVYDLEKTPDGKHKLAQLVRANQALYDLCIAFEIPLISGKDSMKNDANIEGKKISIKPTLLISAIAKIDDIQKTVSMDVKCAGDHVYLIGETKNELGGSELAALLEIEGGEVPKVNPQKAKARYLALHRAIEFELLASCHDCSEGGLAVALAESAFAGGLGMAVHLERMNCDKTLTGSEQLFSETPSRFVATVDPKNASRFEQICPDARKIGVVEQDPCLTIIGADGDVLIKEGIESLKASWQYALGGLI